MTKEKALELLKEAEDRKTEILGNLKDVETFKVGKGIYYLSIIMLLLYLLIITILYYTLFNPLYHFNSYFDFIISPVVYMYNFLFIVMVIFSFSIIFIYTIKIDFNKNCIKFKLFKKIYFDDILDMNIKEDGNLVYISIIDRDGRETLIKYIPKDMGKFLLICKEKLGHKFRTEDNIKYEKKKNKILRTIFKIIIFFIIYKVLGICNDIIIKKYEDGADFSKYGVVREEYFDIGYVESTYKHGRKNGIEKYYDKNGKQVETFEKQTDNLVEYYSIKIRIFEYYRDSRRFKKEIEDLRQFL